MFNIFRIDVHLLIILSITTLAGCFSGFNESPTVLTLEESALGPKSVTLTGLVNPKGGDTTVWFEWGVDQSYGNITEEIPVGSGAEDVNVDHRLDNLLSPNTLYYYRLAARNHLDTIYGVDKTFITTAIPLPTLLPITTNTVIQNTGCTFMEIGVNPNGYDTQAWFEYGTTTTAYGETTLPQAMGKGDSAINFSQVIPNYTFSTTYHYRAKAENEGGISVGEDTLCTTPPPSNSLPPTDPPLVTTNAATDVTPVSVTLNGSGNPLGTDSMGWFEWGTTTGYGNQTVEQSLGNGTTSRGYTQNIAGLQPDTAYHFRAVARGYGNTEVYGSDLTVRTAQIAAVNTGTVTNISPTSMTLNATINPNGFTTSAWFEWGTTISYGNMTLERVIGNGATAQAFNEILTGLSPDTSYHYRIVVRGYGDMIIRGVDKIAATLPVPPPAVTTATPSLVTENSCAFNGTVNPNGFTTSSWFEWGSDTTYGASTTQVSLGTGSIDVPLSAVVTGLTSATSYHYRTAAQNTGGLVYGNDMVCATQNNALEISNIAVTDVTSTNATITWTTSQPATSQVEYGTSVFYGLFSNLDSTLKTQHSRTLANLAPSTIYHYRVISADSGLNPVISGDAIFTTADAPVVSINVAQGKNTSASSTATGYSIAAPVDGITDQSASTGALWKPAVANSGEWYRVDLGVSYIVDQVKLYTGLNGAGNSVMRGFDIETSQDGVNWITRATIINNTSFTRSITFTPVDTRYVRIVVTQGSLLDNYSYLIELEIYQALFALSGTYTSGIFDTGSGQAFTTMNWNGNLNGQSLTLKVRSCDDALCSGEPGFTVLTVIADGGLLMNGGGVFDGHRYVQYQARFITADQFITPTLNEVAINYSGGSWAQTDDSATSAGFNMPGSNFTYTQATGIGGGNVQLGKPPRGGTGQDGAFTCVAGVCLLSGGTYNFTSFNISNGAIVNVPLGGSGLVIYSQEDVNINGILRANGENGAVITPGRGATGGYDGGAGGLGSIRAEDGKGPGGGVRGKYPYGGTTPNQYTSGGGGGFGGRGGDGVNAVIYGIGGAVYGNELYGGSGGGGGDSPSTSSTYAGGGGGGGGGAMRISTSADINIGLSGVIQANGGNSVVNPLIPGYPLTSGGGGSGGGIRLEAASIVNHGTIEANGGAGDGVFNVDGIYYLCGGGGGGGRIGLFENDGVIEGGGIVRATGGNGWVAGENGTITIQIY